MDYGHVCKFETLVQVEAHPSSHCHKDNVQIHSARLMLHPHKPPAPLDVQTSHGRQLGRARLSHILVQVASLFARRF